MTEQPVKPPTTPGRPDHSALKRVFAALPGKLTLRSRLLVSFVGMILFFGIVWSLLGVGLIHRSLPQAQDVLAVDLSAALEIYRQYVSHITDAVRWMARQRTVREHLEHGDAESLVDSLQAIRQSEDLDILFLTDAAGKTVLPASDEGHKVDVPDISAMVEQAIRERREVASTVVVSAADLARESPELMERARIEVVSTSYAGSERPGNVADGMFAAAAVPVVSGDGKLLGILCGAQLLNGRNTITDRIQSNLYREEQFEGHDVVIASIFLGDKRIATSASKPSGGASPGHARVGRGVQARNSRR